MKNYILSAIFLFSISIVMAQDESNDGYKTIFSGSGESSISGFGGINMEFSSVNGGFGYSMGGQGAALFNKSVFIGLYGQALVNFPNYELTSYSALLSGNVTEAKSIMLYHFGIYSGFVFKPNNPIHFGLSSKFGWGGVTLLEDFYNYHGNPGNNYNYPESDFIFVVTPQLDAEINVTNWFKFNLGVGYRFVSGLDATYLFRTSDGELVERPYFDNNAMNSVTFSMGFFFGWYK